LHMHESIDPAKREESLRRWAERPAGTTAHLVERVPPSALALAAGRLDLSAVFDWLTSLVPDIDRLQLDNTLTAVHGLFLGKDLRRDVLPYLGPGLLAYVDAPSRDAGPDDRPPLVVALNLRSDSDEHGVAAAIDNALRTVLAIYAIDPKRKDARLRIESREQGKVRLTTLAGSRPLFAYAVERGMLVLGTSADAVVGYCSAEPQVNPNSRYPRFRAAYFPEAESFAFADLPRLFEAADTRREALARRLAAKHNRPEDAARRDLDQALDLIHLFQGAFATSSIKPDFSAVHRSIGLIASDPPPISKPASSSAR
jgi:hypothetical protein